MDVQKPKSKFLPQFSLSVEFEIKMPSNVKRSRNIPMFVRPTVIRARFITNLFLESILRSLTK